MNRPIKFRGRRLDGPLVYGDLIHYKNGNVAIQIIEGGIYPVIPDSVAQLVGYDKDGREVYEGDTVEGVDDKWVAVLMSDILNNMEDVREAPLKYLTLKENQS